MVRVLRKKALYYVILTALMGFLSVSFLTFFYNAGKSILWSPDGTLQHFTAFRYTAMYWKAVIKSIFIGQKPDSLMNFSIGQGSDMLLSLNTYDFTEPVTVICGILFRNHLLKGYICMIFIKNFLSAVFFSEFCFAKRKECSAGVLCGAIAYAFCSYAVDLCIRHPNFADGIYLLPLILWGVEEALEKKKGKVLILSVAVSILANYYMMYIDALIAAGYVIARVIVNRKETWKSKMAHIFYLVRTCAIGALLSGCVLLPSIYGYLNNSRLGQRTGRLQSLFFYEEQHYLTALKNFLNLTDSGHYTLWGIPVLGVASLILLIGRKESRKLVVGCLILVVLLGIPYAGIIMNGFGYARNIWGYALYFFVSLLIAEGYEKMKKIAYIEAVVICLILSIYNSYYSFIHGVGAVTWLLMAVSVMTILSATGTVKGKKYAVIFTTIMLCNSYYIMYDYYSINAKGRVKAYLDAETVQQFATDGKFKFDDLAFKFDKEDYYRIEKKDLAQNQEWEEDYKGSTYWWSIMPKNENDYYKDLELNTLTQNCNFKGLDGRTALCALAAVRYYISDTEEDRMRPFSYEQVDKTDPYVLYENENTLPLLYMYTSIIDDSYYTFSSPVKKQELLLKGAVSKQMQEDMEKDTIPVLKPEIAIREVPYEIETDQNISFTEKGIEIKKKKSVMTLKIIKNPKSELYVWFEDTALISTGGQMKLEARINGKRGRKDGVIHNMNNNWAVERDGMTMCLGSDTEGELEIELTFLNTGEITFEKLHVQEVSMEECFNDIEKLRAIPVTQITADSGVVSGHVKLTENGILQIALPYSIGWNAYVDGKKTKIYQSRGLYMDVILEKGEHDMELRYHTPFGRSGMFLSMITMGMLIIRSFQRRIGKK